MTTGEIPLTSRGHRVARVATVPTSRTGRTAEERGYRASRTSPSAVTGRDMLFPVLLVLATILLLVLLVLGPSLPWPVTLGVGMLNVLILGVAWAFTGPALGSGER
ncbi:hypothetical protein [Brachybacterium timonense]|uniref:hypothetical protein n=1 Tax=Brachybacterium timonense TaxID=2050896 RepID=UPI000D0B76D3|nr:hypothetical protein [Brachybacterium timonense]